MRCVGCSMVYANPVVSEMATGAFYDQTGLEYLSKEKLESDYSDIRFTRELRLFRSHCSHGSVLDVGCSSGGFLHTLIKRYPGEYEVLGTDISSAPLDYAAKMGIPVVNGDFLSHVFEKRFDAITFWAVMEHLMDPRSFLGKAASILTPAGLCIILVPNFESLAVRLLGAKYRYILPEHLNYFTQRTLKAFVEHEFNIVSITSTHFNPIVILKDFHNRAQKVTREERFKLLRKTSVCKRSPWLYPLRLAYQTVEFGLGKLFLADNLVIVCRKK